MTWSALLGVFLLCHLVGDFLLQTEWQVMHKHGGLGVDRTARRALAQHTLSYTVAFIPALIWVGIETSAPAALGIAALIGIPHALVDDGRVVLAWVRKVKGVPGAPGTVVYLGVDQTMHLLALAAAALAVTA